MDPFQNNAVFSPSPNTGDIILSPSAPAKKSKKPLVIVLIILILLAAGAAAWYFFAGSQQREIHSNQSELAQTLEEYAPSANHLQEIFLAAKDGDLRVVDIIQPDTYNSIRQDMENFESFSTKLATLSQKTFNNDVKAEYQALLAQIISDVEAYKRSFSSYESFYQSYSSEDNVLPLDDTSKATEIFSAETDFLYEEKIYHIVELIKESEPKK